MVSLRATLMLPYLLRLPDGDYPTGGREGPLHLHESYVSGSIGSGAKQTEVSVSFQDEDDADPQRRQGVKKRQAERLVRQTNRLIRWYRAVTRQAAIVELTRAQANPIQFTTVDGSVWATDAPFEYDADPPPADPLPAKSIARAVRQGMVSDADPDVADLFLLDAEQARRDGRFREAVLFCWSTIDSTFNNEYKRRMDLALDGEWSEARKAFTGNEFGMKNKMSAGLYLVTGRSLFREPDRLWEKLATSYTKRNEIIRSGRVADEADADLALDVARSVLAFMKSLNTRKGNRSRTKR